jgi:hypothetical protein
MLQGARDYKHLQRIGKQIDAAKHLMSPPELAVTREEFKHQVERFQALHKAQQEAAAKEAANP